MRVARKRVRDEQTVVTVMTRVTMVVMTRVMVVVMARVMSTSALLVSVAWTSWPRYRPGSFWASCLRWVVGPQDGDADGENES